MTHRFFDTNILLYAIDRRDAGKQRIALDVLEKAAAFGAGCLSTQVMQEFADAAARKFNLPFEAIDERLRLAEQQFRVVATTPRLIFESLRVASRYQLRVYDGLIIAAAEAAGCERVFSEDLNHGQRYGSVLVQNPFLANQETTP